MKQSKIIRAYKTLLALSEQKLPLSVSHKLWTLMTKMAPQWEFQSKQEQDLIAKYEPEIAQDGAVKFKSEEEENACKEEYTKLVSELADLDVEWDESKKTQIHLDDKLDISIGDIEALKDFVDFVE